jgi:DNA-binding NarL/FixJ family response regulator
MISIFIVDDHYMVVEGIRSLLQNETGIKWIGSASTIESCRAFLMLQQPNVLLMDISLPDGNGIDLCKEVKEKYPDINILGISTFNQGSYIKNMMENGACGYVLKNATQKELSEAIQLAAIGKTYMAFEVVKILHAAEKNEANKIVIGKREKEVLELIKDGLTNSEIAQKLILSQHTVDTYRKSLLTKLNARNTAELIKIALQQKLIELKKNDFT